MPIKEKYFAMFHGVNRHVDPVSYKNRNNTTIIICGTEGEGSVLNPLIWFLQYYSQFYEDFVDEFLEFHYTHLGDDYINTYQQQRVGDGKYNHIFKMMMKEHFVFLKIFPNSVLQIFGRHDDIANLSLSATENVDLQFTIPLIEKNTAKMARNINIDNFKDEYYHYSIASKKTNYPYYYKRQDSWIDGSLVRNRYILPMGLTDRNMNIIDKGINTDIATLCSRIPANSYMIVTACRDLSQVLKSQVYKKKPSFQQMMTQFQKLKLMDKYGKRKRINNSQQQQNLKKKMAF
jgi:hypothetical protein